MKFILNILKTLLHKIVDNWLSVLITTLGASSILVLKEWIASELIKAYEWSLASDIYPNWLVAFLVLTSVSLVVFFIVVFLNHFKATKPHAWLKYKSDVIDNTKWNWEYFNETDYSSITNLKATCPTCRADVLTLDDFGDLNIYCTGCNLTLKTVQEMSSKNYYQAIKRCLFRNIRVKFNVD